MSNSCHLSGPRSVQESTSDNIAQFFDWLIYLACAREKQNGRNFKFTFFIHVDTHYEIQILNGLYCPRDRHEKRPIHVVSLVHDLCTGAFRQKQAQDQANKEPFAVAHI